MSTESGPLDGLVSAKEIAEELGLRTTYVTNRAKEGKVPGAHQILGQWFFDREVVLEQWDVATGERDEPEGGRQSDGRFAPGNKLSSGNRGGRAPRSKEESYLKALYQCVTLEEWLEIVQKAKDQAKNGDRYARAWLGNYLVGRPVQRVEAAADVNVQRILSMPEQLALVMQLFQLVETRGGDLGGWSVSELFNRLASGTHGQDDPAGTGLPVEAAAGSDVVDTTARPADERLPESS